MKSLNERVANAMHVAHTRYQRERIGCDVDNLQQRIRRGTHREKAKLNMSKFMQDHLCLDYYKIFCEHDRLRIEDCTKCNRKGVIQLR